MISTVSDVTESKGPRPTSWTPSHQHESDTVLTNLQEEHKLGAAVDEPFGNEDDNVDRVDVKRKITGLSWAIVVVALISSTVLYALDNTVLATVRPSMIKTLGRIDLLGWISAAYPMTEVGSNPLWLVVFPYSACKY
jgi:hypothetical protein